MLAGKLLTVLVAAGCGAWTIPRRSRHQAFPPLQDLEQSEAEIILSAQTILRRYLVPVLSDIRARISDDSRISGIIRGLQKRELDPLEGIQDGGNSLLDNQRSNADKMATIIHRLQGCGGDETSEDTWTSSLSDMSVPPLPSLIVTPQEIQAISNLGRPAVDLALIGIQNHRLKLSRSLLGDILYNFQFRNYSPETSVIVDSLLRFLEKDQTDFTDFKTNPDSREPEKILSDILNHATSNSTEGKLLTIRLLDTGNVENLVEGPHVWSCLDLVTPDDYPPDIIRGKDELTQALRNNELNVDLTRIRDSLRGYSPMEKLLGLVSKLSLIPEESPLAGTIRAMYPHVKLRYLASRGEFFRPRTPSDMSFLLDSFLTLEINGSLIKDISRSFLQSEFGWNNLLDSFDFFRYSKPRTLIVNLLREMLKESDKLPLKVSNLFKRFLNETKLDFGNHNYTNSTTAEAVKECLNASPTKFIDSDSILEIMNTNIHTKFITDLIRYNPVPSDKYQAKTRRDFFKFLLEDLKEGKYNDTISVFVIKHALEGIRLNEKADLPPTYVLLCPEDVRQLEARAPSMKPPEFFLEERTMASPGENSGRKADTLGDGQVVLVGPTKTPPCPPERRIKVIDTEDIIEILEPGNISKKLLDLIRREPISFEEYGRLSTRGDILLSLLRNRTQGQSLPTVEIQVNDKVSLPPRIKEECVVVHQDLNLTPEPEVCPPGESLTAVYNTTSVLDALIPSAMNIREQIKGYAVPQDHETNRTKAEVLGRILDALGLSGEALVVRDGPGQEQALVIPACLPKDGCRFNEVMASVVDTNTIVEALSPNVTLPPYLRLKIKGFVVPIGILGKYTKGDVLRDLLTRIQHEVGDSKVKDEIESLKANLLSTGPGLEEPGITKVCGPSSLFQKIQNKPTTPQHPTTPALPLSFISTAAPPPYVSSEIFTQEPLPSSTDTSSPLVSSVGTTQVSTSSEPPDNWLPSSQLATDNFPVTQTSTV